MREYPASVLSSPNRSQLYGFSCKVWFAYQLEKQYLGGLYYAWFARELNPIQNGESSNPLDLYRSLDHAVKREDVNHPKIKDFRATLMSFVRRYVAEKDRALARSLRHEVLRAPMEMYRRQLWRIDLSKVAAARVKTDRSNAGWDEQYIPDLNEDEFEVIVP